MLAKVSSGAVLGVDAYRVEVEVDLSNGVPNFSVVGLGDTAVQEAKERVRSAIKNSDYEFHPRRLTINLAPANVKKEGPLFDLPIALGVLVASEQIQAPYLEDFMIVGELSLDGAVRPVSGCLPIAIAAKEAGFRGVLVPAVNAREAALVEGLTVFAVETLSQAAAILSRPEAHDPVTLDREDLATVVVELAPDFSEVRGQAQTKRALEIAAAGGHNIIIFYPLSTGGQKQ